jgi:RNase P/RNase MRP subunit POP5
MIKETILISTLALFGLSGCASFMPEVTKYSTEPVERPLLVLPESEIINMKDVDYIVVTRENVEEVWAELEASGKSIVLFALTHEGYENLALNNADIIRYLSEQKAVIIAYKEYYEKADKAIVDANDKNQKKVDAEASSSFSIKKFLNSD